MKINHAYIRVVVHEQVDYKLKVNCQTNYSFLLHFMLYYNIKDAQKEAV